MTEMSKAQKQALALAMARKRQQEAQAKTQLTPEEMQKLEAMPQVQRGLATGGPRMEQERIAAQRAEGERIGEAITDPIKAFTAGLGRGVTGLADLPETMAKLGARSGAFVGEKAAEAMGLDRSEQAEALRNIAAQPTANIDRLSRLTGGASEFRGETLPGKFAGTVGEFVPGAAAFGGMSPANLAKFAVVPGVASEAAGQATEGTSLEPYARIAGAILAPTAVNVGTSAFKALFAKSAKAPTIENLKALKTEAYRAADRADVSFSPKDTESLLSRARAAMDDANFVPEADIQTKAAFQTLTAQSGKSLTLGQMDKLRQSLWTRYNADKSQVAILGMIDAIDDVIQGSTKGGPLMAAARLANSRFKKAEMIDDAFRKATDQTAATGSGGNILNKYRQAVTAIINDPKRARWFSTDEIDVMRNFVRGSTTQNLLRLGGKLSPSGNGLMAALNLGAVAVNPAMLAVSAGSSAAKALADRGAMQGAARIQDMLATGVVPQAAQPQRLQPGQLGGLLSGFSANN